MSEIFNFSSIPAMILIVCQDQTANLHDKVHGHSQVEVPGPLQDPEDRLHQGSQDSDGGQDVQPPRGRASEEPQRHRV